MSTQVQYRRGSNVQVAAFTGALGELVIDTTNKIVVVNDGATAGGFPQVGLTASQTITNKVYQGTTVSVTGDITAAGNVNGLNLNSTNADLAELYTSDAKYAPGTVIKFGGTHEVTITDNSHSTAVAGIVSTSPGHLMNSKLTGEHVVAVALTGRVPCRVSGNIQKGDRLVSSTISGVATVLDTNQYQPGCIIGKSLEHYNSEEVGVIEVAVGRF
jgi:hypothetical protein